MFSIILIPADDDHDDDDYNYNKTYLKNKNIWNDTKLKFFII